MSQFLAPIHTWLFNKIIILENIEKNILNSLENSEVKEQYQVIQDKFGDFIPNEPIENLIDPSNIHGWLQQRITVAEMRQAALIKRMIDNNENAIEDINHIYYQAGVNEATNLTAVPETATELFKAINDVLLEGMPCDRVNSVLEQSEESVKWETVRCVHQMNWENSGVDVDYYYQFRASFTLGFVETVNPKFTYTYENQGRQLHQIKSN